MNDQNPYAPPRPVIDEARSRMLPRRWWLWALCDGAYFGVIFGVVNEMIVAAVLMLCQATLSSDGPLPELAIELAVYSGLVTLLSHLLMGSLLAAWPKMPAVLWNIFWTFMAVTVVTFGPGSLLNLVRIRMEPLDNLPPLIAFCLLLAMNIVGLVTLARFLNSCIVDWSRMTLIPVAEVGAQLMTRGWMRRVLDVTTPEGVFILDYAGKGLGNERVRVDGHVVAEANSHITIVPKFEFALGPRRCTLHVTGWPWMTLRSLVVAIDDVVVYREGF